MINLDTHLVAVLDVLGIKNAINNATPDELHEMANGFIKALEMGIVSLEEEFAKRLTPEVIKDFTDLYNRTHLWNFSDTLVVTLNLNPFSGLDDDSKNMAISLFFARTTVLFSTFFDMGFPSRCCIDVGGLDVRNNFVFGKPYVNAFLVSDALDFSGLVMTDAAYESFSQLPVQLQVETRVCKLIAPLNKKINGRHEMPIWCVDWLGNVKRGLRTAIEKDRQHFYDVFSQHGKSINNSVERKIQNTERILREIAAKTTMPTNQ